jgi:hypothetical protein
VATLSGVDILGIIKHWAKVVPSSFLQVPTVSILS